MCAVVYMCGCPYVQGHVGGGHRVIVSVSVALHLSSVANWPWSSWDLLVSSLVLPRAVVLSFPGLWLLSGPLA